MSSHSKAMSGLRAIGGDVESALERISVPAYVIDTAGVIRWVNSAGRRLVGDVRGRQFTSVVAPEDQRFSRDLFAQKIAGTACVTDAEVVLVDADGDRLVVEISSVPLTRGDRVIGVFGQVLHEEVAPARAHPALTPRQSEVLRLLEHGFDAADRDRAPPQPGNGAQPRARGLARSRRAFAARGGRDRASRSPACKLTRLDQSEPPARQARYRRGAGLP